MVANASYPSNSRIPWPYIRLARRQGAYEVMATIASMRLFQKSQNSPALAGLAIVGLALGATAVGAMAIGALAIGRLVVRQGRIEKLSIGELTVDRLIVKEQHSI
jgi:hypothetical protein